MTLKPFLRPLFECGWKVLWKLCFNMCWRGFWGMRKFERALKKGEGFFPAFLMISLTDKCNYRCKGCWVSNAKRCLDFDALDNLICAAKKRGSYFFGLLGGEPLMYPRILDILKRHKDCYFQIFTNGSLLDDAFAKALADLGNATVLISLEGLDEESASRRGAKNAFSDALRAMENCRKHKLFWGVATSVCKSNFDELVSEKHLEFLKGQGALYVWYYIYRPVGASPNPELALDASEIKRLRRFLVDSRDTAPLLVIDAYWDDKGRAICPAAVGLSHHISPAGDFEFCPPMQFAAEAADAKNDAEKLFANSKFLKDLREFTAKRSRGCILLEDPQALKKFLETQDIYDTSGRLTALCELEKMNACAGHDMGADAIPESNFFYKMLKKKYFFGFGAYG